MDIMKYNTNIITFKPNPNPNPNPRKGSEIYSDDIKVVSFTVIN